MGGFRQHELQRVLAEGGGGEFLLGFGGLDRDPAPAEDQSDEPSFRQGALPGQNREGNF